jgi:hypothetical protein
MEPTFSSAASMTTVTPELAAQIEAAIAALPAAHRLPPQEQEIVESKETALQRLQNWAFTEGFALAVESGRADRVLYHCVHHKKATKNSHKTAEADRQRVQTHTQARGCKFALYISKTKRSKGRWAINSSNLEHNHAPNPDPFQYTQHQAKQPGYSKALATAATHVGVISYTVSVEILRKEGLELDRKKYYNLGRKEESEGLTRQEEL